MRPIARPAARAAGICTLAFAAVLLDPARLRWGYVAWAGGLAAAVVLVGAFAPWRRMPRSARLVLSIGCEGVIALLHHAGGAASAIPPLAIVPVAWVGLTLGLPEVAAIVAVSVVVFVGSDWRETVVRSAVAAIVGVAGNRITAAHRRRSGLLDRLVSTQTAIANSGLNMDAVLSAVVEEAMRLTRADSVHVVVPDGDGLVSRAVAGTAPPVGFRFPFDSLSGRAFTTLEPIHCRDTELDERVDRTISSSTRTRSIIAVPLLHDGRAMGVLAVGHHEPDALDEQDVRALSLLGSVIGTALVRAELVAMLAAQAVTDDLTGLPNRRAWHEHLTLAFNRARRSGLPLSVVVLDLDGFKQVNDVHGHVEGDRLLREAAHILSGALRDMDILGRIGGDEFGVILEGADADAAADVVSRLPEAGASAGIATWDGLEDAASLLTRADAEMYRQKRLRSVA